MLKAEPFGLAAHVVGTAVSAVVCKLFLTLTESVARLTRWMNTAHVVGGDRRSTRFDFRKRNYCRTLNQLCGAWDARGRIIIILYILF